MLEDASLAAGPCFFPSLPPLATAIVNRSPRFLSSPINFYTRVTHGKKKKKKVQGPTMRPHAFLGISSYRDARDARRKSEPTLVEDMLESFLMLFMTFYAFLIISVYKILNFGHFSQKHYIHTDGPTDQRTDSPSYRDARTHLISIFRHIL